MYRKSNFWDLSFIEDLTYSVPFLEVHYWRFHCSSFYNGTNLKMFCGCAETPFTRQIQFLFTKRFPQYGIMSKMSDPMQVKQNQILSTMLVVLCCSIYIYLYS